MINKLKLVYGSILGIAMLWVSCNEEVVHIDSKIITDANLNSPKESFEVKVNNRQIQSFSSNNLGINYLGVYQHPVYGKTEAEITTQFSLSGANPNFGKKGLEGQNKVTKVLLHIPFFKDSRGDSDNDGVPDTLDKNPTNPNNDNDGDGISNIRESAIGTNPLNQDTDNDGIKDNVDRDTERNIFPRRFQLDSIHGNLNTTFNIKVYETKFFLRRFDPSTNFTTPQLYSSDFNFNGFLGQKLADSRISVSDSEKVTINEMAAANSENRATRTAPGIQVELQKEFFQTNIIDKEGSIELFNNNNFKQHFRGITITSSAFDKNVLMGLDLRAAKITITYEYQEGNNAAQKKQANFELNVQNTNVVVNTYKKEDFTIPENDPNIYLRGGAGNYAELQLELEGTNPVIRKLKNKKAVLNEANLVFHVNREKIDAKGVAAEDPLRLYLYKLKNNKRQNSFSPIYNPRFDVVDSKNPLKSYLVYDGRLSKNNNGKGQAYRIRITDHIYNVILRDSLNVPLGLSLTNNINSITLRRARRTDGAQTLTPVMNAITPLGTVLYGGKEVAGKEDKKLKLELIYTDID